MSVAKAHTSILLLQITPILTDEDECRLKTDNCHENADCIDIPGSFSCICSVGYSGDGIDICKGY